MFRIGSSMIPVVLIAFSLIATSCEDLTLDEEGEVVDFGDPALEEDLRQVAATGYAQFSRFYGNNQRLGHILGDDIVTGSTEPGSNKQEFLQYDQFNPTSTNGVGNGTWNGLWDVIINVNQSLLREEEYVVLSDTSEVFTKEVFESGFAELRFIRALAMFELTRGWGRIPIIDSQEKLETSPNVANTIEEVYDFIIADLIAARDGLSETGATAYRPSKYTAQALLANVYLHQAGFPLKKEGAYASAAIEAKTVIDAGVYELETYDRLFATVEGENAGTYPVKVSDGNKEAIIAFPLGRVNQWSGSDNLLGHQTVQWGDKIPEVAFFESFPEGTGERYNATYLVEIEGNDGEIVNFKDFKNEAVAGGNLEGILSLGGDAPSNRPIFQKWGNEGFGDPTGTGYDVFHTRYAELLLIYAEAEIRSGGSVSNAATELNKVRERAGLDPIASPSADDVVQERAWEMAGEWTRWHDLIRLELIQEANANRSNREAPIIGVIDELDPWMPYPATEGIVAP